MTSKSCGHRLESQFATLKPFGNRNLRPPFLVFLYGMLLRCCWLFRTADARTGRKAYADCRRDCRNLRSSAQE